MRKKPDSKIGFLEYVLEYHNLGWCIIPVPYGTKKARIKWGKYQKSRPDENQLRKWFANGRRNMAVVLGEVSGGLVCRDFDTIDSYETWKKCHPDLAAILPTVRTGKGYHVYFLAPVPGRKDIKGNNGEHLGELRGSGHYCMLPQSVHPNGSVYEWVIFPNGEGFLALDPEQAGFLPKETDVTEQTENTEPTEKTENTEAIEGGEEENESARKGGKTKTDETVESAVEEAICATLPKELHTRNHQIFEFGRTLKSLPQFVDIDPREFRRYVELWHERALPNIATKEFEETWIDFLKAWPRIKYAKGDEPMAVIYERAVRLEPPKIAVEKYPDHGKLKILVSLCRELQRAAGNEPFFLSARTAGRLLEVSPMQANRWLFLLKSDGILKLICKGGTADTVRQASRYRYVAG